MKLNYKNLILLIAMGVAGVGIISDFIQLMLGATYTWIGVITSFINIAIIGKGLDHLRG